MASETSGSHCKWFCNVYQPSARFHAVVSGANVTGSVVFFPFNLCTLCAPSLCEQTNGKLLAKQLTLFSVTTLFSMRFWNCVASHSRSLLAFSRHHHRTVCVHRTWCHSKVPLMPVAQCGLWWSHLMAKKVCCCPMPPLPFSCRSVWWWLSGVMLVSSASCSYMVIDFYKSITSIIDFFVGQT